MACLADFVLTDYVAAQRILEALWGLHDDGGISMGRAYRNRLLEAIRVLLPISNSDRDIPLDKCMMYLEKRKGEERRGQAKQLTFPTPPFLEGLDLAFLLLLLLQEVYAADDKEMGFINITEKSLVDAAVFLLEPFGRLPEFYAFNEWALLSEADDRRHSISERAVEMNFQSMGLWE